MRLDILLPMVRSPEMLRHSLDALADYDADIYEARLNDLEDHLYERLRGIQKAIAGLFSRHKARHHLEKIDRLMILSDLFPEIHISRGLAYRTAAGLSGSGGSSRTSPFSVLEDLLAKSSSGSSSKKETSDTTDNTRDSQKQEWLAIAVESFETAIEALPQQHQKMGKAYEMLGALHRDTGSYTGALQAYEQAAENGGDVQQKIESILSEMAEQTQKRILARVDALLNAKRLDEADDLLRAYAPQPLPDAWRVRFAEMLFLRDDAITNPAVLRHYKKIIPDILPDSAHTDDDA
jgi:tetratricopeptide (TPR) repeat protein